jgi:prepilin-type N-terminal cleavage/methylation domain-containing protein
MKKEARRKQKGFTLAEVLVGSALFLVVAIAAYGAFTSLLQLAGGAQARTIAVALADEQLEIVRNMPYTSVGLTNGIPLGVLSQIQTLSRGGITFTVTLTVRNVNLSTSTVQASDKLVAVDVECPACKDYQPVILTGLVSPANLQSAGNGGALVVKAIDANGQPIAGASVSVQSTATSSVKDNDVTGNDGTLNIVGVPEGGNTYRIIVTKAGYSTDQTYPIGGAAGTSPSKPDATVLNQQVTTASFAIDRLSSLSFTSVTPLCVPVPNFHFSMIGTKQIGDGVYKYPLVQLSTGGSGSLALSNMEWDTYTLNPTDGSYDAFGINPYSPFALNANNAQNVQFVVVPKNGNSLVISVADRVTGLPLSGATVELSDGGSYDQSQITGQGYLTQTDWSGGSGQSLYSTQNQYSADNGLVDTTGSPGDVHLRQTFGSYNTAATATLESSTFDTGTSSNFYTFAWDPIGQPQLAGAVPVKFQFATSPSSMPDTWNYIGPDGTAGSYFSVPGASINAASNGNEYARYKGYVTTDTATVTPTVSGVSFAYTSGCIPPGQVIFQGLAQGTYTVSVSKPGYVSYSNPSITVGSGWQNYDVIVGP